MTRLGLDRFTRADLFGAPEPSGLVTLGQPVELDLAYRLPVLCGDERNERRLHHTDLAGLGDAELQSELLRVSMVLAFGKLGAHPWAREWLVARVQAADAELAARARGGRL
jgi:hypothetical protein